MIPAKYNLIVPQGATFDTTITWTIDGTPVNLTGYAAALQARESHKSVNASIDLGSYDTAFDSALDGINIGYSDDGTIRIHMTAGLTAALHPKTYVYDLEVNSPTDTYRMLEGTLTVTPEVTRG